MLKEFNQLTWYYKALAIIVLVTPYIITTVLLMSMTSRQSIYNWLVSQLTLGVIMQAFTLGAVITFRVELAQIVLKFSTKVDKALADVEKELHLAKEVIHKNVKAEVDSTNKKLWSVQNDLNKLQKQVISNQKDLVTAQTEIKVLKEIFIKN